MERIQGTHYLAECLWPGVTDSELIAADSRARVSADATANDAEPVRYLGSIFVREDDVAFFFFSGRSSGAVTATARRAGIPFERVVESVRISDEVGSQMCRKGGRKK